MTFPQKSQDEKILEILGCSITEFHKSSTSFKDRYASATHTQQSLCNNNIFFRELRTNLMECKHIHRLNGPKVLLQHKQSFHNFRSALHEIVSMVNKTFQDEIGRILSGIRHINESIHTLMPGNTKFIKKHIEDTRKQFNMTRDSCNEKVHFVILTQFVIRLNCFKKSVIRHCVKQ